GRPSSRSAGSISTDEFVEAAKGRELTPAAPVPLVARLVGQAIQNVGSVVVLLRSRRRVLLNDRRRLSDGRSRRFSSRHLVLSAGGEKTDRRQRKECCCRGLHDVLLVIVIPRIRSWLWSSFRSSAQKPTSE